MSSRWGRALGLLAALAAGAVLVLTVPLCPLANLTGWPCPSCGLTRATLLLLHGDWAAALTLQPLTPAVLLLIGLCAGGASLRYVSTGEPVTPWSRTSSTLERVFEWLAAALSGALVMLWLARFAGMFGGPVPVQARWLEALTGSAHVANRK
jgi:hypothetical protein